MTGSLFSGPLHIFQEFNHEEIIINQIMLFRGRVPACAQACLLLRKHKDLD